MASKRTTIIGWSGRGSQRDLESSVANVLRLAGLKQGVVRKGRALLVEGEDPVEIAGLVQRMPGVSWVAVGLGAGSTKELGRGAGALAGKYLGPGRTFAVAGDVSGGPKGDIVGLLTSAILERAKGARTVDEGPDVRFRASFDGAGGAVGVELAGGPGGVPTGTEAAVCLVSGGSHSAVVCWLALLAGFRVRMLHAKVDDASLRAVAKLYAEMSHRADPSHLSLEVLSGGTPASLLGGRLGAGGGRAFAGFHAGCSDVPRLLESRVTAPAYLLPEEWFDREFGGLSLKGDHRTEAWTGSPRKAVERMEFGGEKADVSSTLDGLLRRSPVP
jgi:hypothetical protein